VNALFQNATGSDNTASGWGALFSNTTANNNTAMEAIALLSNTSGFQNTASGFGSSVSGGSNRSVPGTDSWAAGALSSDP